jgi:hypothetical protein
VELKGANIQNLVHRYRGPGNPQAVAGQNEEVPLIVGREVHEPVGQVMNYLCRLDEGRDHILTRFKIEARRATGTVLIGHPDFVQDFSGEEIASTLRIYNSHLSRIEVIHYKDLIENAERALALATGYPVHNCFGPDPSPQGALRPRNGVGAAAHGIRTTAETATSLTSHRNAGLEQPSGALPGSIRLRPGSGRRPRGSCVAPGEDAAAD